MTIILFDVGHFLNYNLAYGPIWSGLTTALAKMPLHTGQTDHISSLVSLCNFPPAISRPPKNNIGPSRYEMNIGAPKLRLLSTTSIPSAPCSSWLEMVSSWVDSPQMETAGWWTWEWYHFWISYAHCDKVKGEWSHSRCDFRPLKPWKLASSHKNTALAKTLGSSPSRSSSCPLQICCHCGCWWCTWPKWTVLLSNQKSSDSVERGSLQLSTPSPAACTAATESTSQPVAIFHEISLRLPPRNSQRSQELMLLICTRRGINLCSNELGIPQRGRFRRAPWHICCYCRSIPFTHLK